MNILFIGDIVGKVGRKALKKNLSFIKEKYNIDFTIANGENISNGRGISLKHYNFLLDEGVDCITLGNHYADKMEEFSLFIDNEDIVRPLNLKKDIGGEGSRVFEVNGIKIRVTNILGEVFMKEEVYSPYQVLSNVCKGDDADIHIVDYHAEATGEKLEMAYAFEGEISALLGTHTHVQTNDASILDDKTAYMSDVGMCGARNGILGFEKESVIDKQIFHKNAPMKLADDAPYEFCCVILNFDDISLKIKKITPLRILGE